MLTTNICLTIHVERELELRVRCYTPTQLASAPQLVIEEPPTDVLLKSENDVLLILTSTPARIRVMEL